MPGDDWPSAPAKMIAVLALGALCAAGMGYAMVRGSTPSRAQVRVEPERFVPLSAAQGDGPATPGAGGQRPNSPSAVALKININTASKPELELLPGIGPSLADRIIAERQRGGAFARVEDLGRVRGIGGRTIERLRDHVVCEDPPGTGVERPAPGGSGTK